MGIHAMTKQEIIKAIGIQAAAHGLDPILCEAVVWQESNYNQWAMRYEKLWRYFVVWNTGKPWPRGMSRVDFPRPPGCSRSTEVSLQKHSFGCYQMMGSVARENGFRGAFLTELLDPMRNIQYGVAILKKYIKQKDGDARKGLVRWNGRTTYPDEVFEKMELLKKERGG